MIPVVKEWILLNKRYFLRTASDCFKICYNSADVHSLFK